MGGGGGGERRGWPEYRIHHAYSYVRTRAGNSVIRRLRRGPGAPGIVAALIYEPIN